MESDESVYVTMPSEPGQSTVIFVNKTDNLASFSASSSLSCSESNTPSRRMKMCERLDLGSDLLLSNRIVNGAGDTPRRMDKNNGDEFWAALQSHYNYLMDDGLIESCKEANGELSWDDEDLDEQMTWSFTEYIEQFDELSEWLDSIQVSVSEESSITSTTVSSSPQSANVSRSDDIKNKAYQRTIFNEQSQKLGRRYPNMKDEILNRVVLLNNKWDAFEKVIAPCDDITSHDSLLKDGISKVKCLRRWLHLLETKIQPLILHPQWTLQDLEQNLEENNVQQKEIESYSKFISSVLNSFDKLCSSETTVEECGGRNAVVKCRCKSVRRVAINLERRWHSIWLRSLEWRYLLEELIRKCKSGHLQADTEFDLSFGLDEPLNKVPRLGNVDLDGSNYWLNVTDESINQDDEDDDVTMNQLGPMSDSRHSSADRIDDSDGLDSEQESNVCSGANTTHRGIMVGTTGITELKKSCIDSHGRFGKIEIVQDVGYSSESSTHSWNNGQFEHTYSYDAGSKMKSSAMMSVACDESENGKDEVDGKNAYKLVNSPSKEFYTMTSIMMDDLEDGRGSADDKMVDSGICCAQNERDANDSLAANDKRMVMAANSATCGPESLQVTNNDDKTSGFKGRKNDRVKEWLNNQGSTVEMLKQQHLTVIDSSCDASGEYTSNDEDSSDSSEDVNSSIVTCKRMSGSLGSGIHNQHMNNETAVSPIKSNDVMRRKKRRSRDRPWSVTELYQMSSQLDLSPFSISETALNNISKESTITSLEEVPVAAKSYFSPSSDKLNDRSVRKKKTCRRRRNNESSGSMDGLSPANLSSNCGSDSTRSSPSRNLHPNLLTGSSSGAKTHSSSSCAENNLGDPSCKVVKSRYSGNSNSGSETDDEVSDCRINQPISLTNNCLSTSAIDVDIQQQPSEEIGSFSDQAWDSYQDPPYLSEACSEFTVDDTTLKNLMEFGDDYRAFIGSQSDTVSLLSHRSEAMNSTSCREEYNGTKIMLRKSGLDNNDSDSDLEDLHHIIYESESQFHFAEAELRKIRTNQFLAAENKSHMDFAELDATCHTNVRCLQVIKGHLNNGGSLPNVGNDDLYHVQGIIDQWERLSEEINECRNTQEQISKISQEIEQLKRQLDIISCYVKVPIVDTFEQLVDWISTLQETLSTLQDIKSSLVSVSTNVSRLVPDSDVSTASRLKNDIKNMYDDWEDIYENVGGRLTESQKAKCRWQGFVAEYDKLRSLLNKTPSSDSSSNKDDFSSSVFEMKQRLSWLRRHVSRESLSSDCDSGIGLWDGATDLLQDVEKEIDRLMITDDSRSSNDVFGDGKIDVVRIVKETVDDRIEPGAVSINSHRSSSGSTTLWAMFRRVMRGALPFHLAIVIMYCFAWLMEPRCCDHTTSFNSQLHYDRGPPPF